MKEQSFDLIFGKVDEVGELVQVDCVFARSLKTKRGSLTPDASTLCVKLGNLRPAKGPMTGNGKDFKARCRSRTWIEADFPAVCFQS